MGWLLVVHCLGALGVEGVYDGVVQILNSTELFLADTWLRLGNIPELENTGVNLVDVDRNIDNVAAGHLLDIRLELPNTFTHYPCLMMSPLSLIPAFGAVGKVLYDELAKVSPHQFRSTRHLCREELCSQLRGSSR